MNRSVFIWIFTLGVIVTILFAFNYRGGKKDAASLSGVFPEEEAAPVDIEYEFVNQEVQPATTEALREETQSVVASATVSGEDTTTAAPAATSTVGSFTDVPAGSAFTIQTASFRVAAQAQKAAEGLKAKGFDAYVGLKTNKKSGSQWYRLCVGSFASKAEAESILKSVKKIYGDSFIIRP